MVPPPSCVIRGKGCSRGVLRHSDNTGTPLSSRLTRLYSSLFPRSSSSSLCRRESDLRRGGETQRWATAEAEFIGRLANTYSGRNVSRFSRSSSDAKLERLQKGRRGTVNCSIRGKMLRCCLFFVVCFLTSQTVTELVIYDRGRKKRQI